MALFTIVVSLVLTSIPFCSAVCPKFAGDGSIRSLNRSLESVASFTCSHSMMCSSSSGTACLPGQNGDVSVSWDLSRLHLNNTANGTDYQLCDTNNNNWYTNICGVTNSVCPGGVNGVGLMVDWLNPSVCYILATELQSIGPIDPLNVKTGLRMTYNNGDYNGCPNQTPRSLTINVYCSESIVSGAIPTTAGPLSVQECSYHIDFESSAGCPNIIYYHSNSDSSLSGGSIFLIIFFTCTALYLGIGIGSNAYRKSRGEEVESLIPHVAFWRQIPGLVTDGMIFFLARVTCGRIVLTPGSHRSDYDTISEPLARAPPPPFGSSTAPAPVTRRVSERQFDTIPRSDAAGSAAQPYE